MQAQWCVLGGTGWPERATTVVGEWGEREGVRERSLGWFVFTSLCPPAGQRGCYGAAAHHRCAPGLVDAVWRVMAQWPWLALAAHVLCSDKVWGIASPPSPCHD